MNKERTMQTGGVGKRIAKEYKTELSMLAIFVVFFAVLSFASPYFLTTKNIMNVMSQVSSTALMAIGMTLVIITSGIDLSVGSTLGLSGMVGCMILMFPEPAPARPCHGGNGGGGRRPHGASPADGRAAHRGVFPA